MEKMLRFVSPPPQYVGWEEVVLSKEKGKRRVHYYLKKRSVGSSWDLAVVGRERSLRHMSYHYALPISQSQSSCPLKLRSRRDVLDWLSSVVSDLPSHSSMHSLGNSLDTDVTANENPHVKKLAKEFSWLGSSWTCRKHRKHYKSFCRNGIKISVHEFVYVLAEDNKRLVAHLEDLYEDSRGNKMVVVRWFHKADEVGLVLPPNFNDREIFFSLCLQDLSVECIDGLATILNSQHFKKYLNEARHTLWQPFMCHRLFHEDNLSAFDITHVQGYWKQEILRYMYTTPTTINSKLADDSLPVGNDDGGDDATIKARPLKRQCRSKSNDVVQHRDKKNDVKEAARVDIQKFSNDVVSSCGAEISGLKYGKFIGLLGEKMIKQIHNQQLTANCQVEVLSQDSGIRGCWFRAMVLKRHKDKVKVQYQDIKDAENEANYLEEWILASKIAMPDKLGFRNFDRTTIRPKPSYCKGRVLLDLVDTGTMVDAWWNDGWWEGIVVRKELEDRILVYFPGEGKLSIFGCEELRLSQDWVSNQWSHVKGQPDLVSSILYQLQTSQDGDKFSNGSANFIQHLIFDDGRLGNINTSPSDEYTACYSECQDDNKKQVNNVPDLTKDGMLIRIKWNSSRKRRRNGESSSRRRRHISSQNSDGSSTTSSSGQEDVKSPPGPGRYLVPNSLNVDRDKCNYRGNSIVSASMPSLPSLVMSR